MSSSPDPLPSGRVIRHAERTALIFPVPVAPVYRAPVVEEPATAFEELLENARREGLEEGRRAGAADAYASLDAARAATVRRTATRLGAAVQEVATLRQQVVDEVVGDLVDLVVELVEVIVGRELALGNRPVHDAVVRALALAPEGPALTIHVHPECGLDDHEILAMAPGGQLTVVRDPGVDTNGCEITAGGCHIDVQVPTALARVRKAVAELPMVESALTEPLDQERGSKE
jgi:flagellar biosynthesis/type III secretory pathway protein FliH